jgi:hypothetical protein
MREPSCIPAPIFGAEFCSSPSDLRQRPVIGLSQRSQ